MFLTIRRLLTPLLGLCVFILFASDPAYSQSPPPFVLPGPADAGRLNQQQEDILPPRRDDSIRPQDRATPVPAPPEASKITFILRKVIIDGSSVYDEDDFGPFYESDIGKKIPLAKIWQIAASVTNLYQQDGYFLSKAFVPAQEIDAGIVRINVVEGYVDRVVPENFDLEHRILKKLTSSVSAERPLRLQTLERALLLLNDIPGFNFESLLRRPERPVKAGAVELILQKTDEQGRGTIFLDNHGSRFTGPQRHGAAYEKSFFPFQNTVVSGSASIPDGDEVWSTFISHAVTIDDDKQVRVSAGRTKSQPGFSLTPSEVESESLLVATELIWSAIRQRQTNLSLGLSLELNNVNTDILGTPLTRDRIRIVRAKATYSHTDRFNGFNFINLEASRGLSGLGANNPGELTLSRAEAEPDFVKVKLEYQRQQFISSDFLVTNRVQGQYSTKELYSSEEFGFGGASLGRAYDFSEITGDHGLAASIDLQYYGIKPIEDFTFIPGVFFDIGRVWNIDQFQVKSVSAASTGLTLSVAHESGVEANFIAALPLTKDVDTPIQGNNGTNPRYYFQLNYDF